MGVGNARGHRCSRALGWFSSSASSRATRYPVSRKTPALRSITRVEVAVVLGRAVPGAGAHRVLAEPQYRVSSEGLPCRRPFSGFSCRATTSRPAPRRSRPPPSPPPRPGRLPPWVSAAPLPLPLPWSSRLTSLLEPNLQTIVAQAKCRCRFRDVDFGTGKDTRMALCGRRSTEATRCATPRPERRRRGDRTSRPAL